MPAGYYLLTMYVLVHPLLPSLVQLHRGVPGLYGFQYYGQSSYTPVRASNAANAATVW